MSEDKSGIATKTAPISIYPILSVNFVGTLGFSIVLPFLVFLVTRFGGNALVYGIMGATYSAFQLVGAPILGRWSDRHGRRKILLLSQFGTLTSWVIFLIALYLPLVTVVEVESTMAGQFALTLPLVVLFFARALDGITGGNVSVANAYLADISSESERSKNFGKMAISANLGFIVGPALAGVLGATAWGETLPVLAAAAISLVASLIILFKLPESRPVVIEKDPEQANMRKIFGQECKECFEIKCKHTLTFRDLLKLERVPHLLLIHFMVFLGFNFFYIAFPVHAVQGLHWQLTDTGVFFSFLGGTMVLAQGPLLSLASKKWSESRLVLAGSFILAMSFVCFLSGTIWLIYSGAALMALGNGIMWPSLLSLVSTSTAERFQGTVQGFASSSGSFASIVGLLAGGLLYNMVGSQVFLLSAAILFVVFVMASQLRPVAARAED